MGERELVRGKPVQLQAKTDIFHHLNFENRNK